MQLDVACYVSWLSKYKLFLLYDKFTKLRTSYESNKWRDRKITKMLFYKSWNIHIWKWYLRNMFWVFRLLKFLMCMRWCVDFFLIWDEINPIISMHVYNTSLLRKYWIKYRNLVVGGSLHTIHILKKYTNVLFLRLFTFVCIFSKKPIQIKHQD